MNKQILYLSKWINDYCKKTHTKGIVVGISGGIDSAVVANIASLNKSLKVIGVWMNINNSKLDFKCVELLKKQHQFKIIDIDLTSTFNSLKKLIKIKSKLTLSNLKARLRMATLYSVANENTLLVAGTGNADELYMGYFTKYGDGACDILPIANLTKSEVKLFAEELKVPQIIIDRPPSASLFEGQTDEKEMGVTYKEIDDFLNNKKISNESRSIIKSYHSKNLHKQNLPVKPIF